MLAFRVGIVAAAAVHTGASGTVASQDRPLRAAVSNGETLFTDGSIN